MTARADIHRLLVTAGLSATEADALIDRHDDEHPAATHVDGFPATCPHCHATQSHCNCCGNDMYDTGGA